MGIFQGHLIYALLCNVSWVILWIMVLRMFGFPKIGRGMKIKDWILLYLLVLLIPNSTYALFEIKHLLMIDTIADVPSLSSFIVFGGISLFGLVTAIWSSQLAANHYLKDSNRRWICHFVISLVLGFGGVVGLLNFESLVAFVFPPVLIFIAVELFKYQALIYLALGTALFFFLSNILIDRLRKPS